MRQTEKNVSPMSNEGRNLYVVQHITASVLELIQDQDLSDLTISQICEQAGVGRASFYRNFSSKEDVLRQEANRLAAAWKAEYERQEHSDPSELLISLLDFYKLHTPFFLSLYKAGLTEIVLDTILAQSEITPELPNPVAYLKSSVAYMIYGWVVEWFKRGMQESGSELARMMEASQKEKLHDADKNPPLEQTQKIE